MSIAVTSEAPGQRAGAGLSRRRYRVPGGPWQRTTKGIREMHGPLSHGSVDGSVKQLVRLTSIPFYVIRGSRTVQACIIIGEDHVWPIDKQFLSWKLLFYAELIF